jgi:hypothetical protein
MKKLVGVMSVAALVAGCATPYQPVPFDRASAGITHLVIVEDAMPEAVGTQKLATNGQNMAAAAGASLGLAGILVGAVAAGIEANIEAGQRAKIQAALATQNFDGEAIFDEAFNAALAGMSYPVSSVSMTRETNRDLIKLTADAAAPTGHGLLDVTAPNYGYQLVGSGTQWRPFVVMAVRLSDPRDPARVLMDNRVVYNPVGPVESIINIAPDESCAFETIELLEANAPKAAECLRTAIVASANAAAGLLR